jgi:hypothetical protein
MYLDGEELGLLAGPADEVAEALITVRKESADAAAAAAAAATTAAAAPPPVDAPTTDGAPG